MPHGWAGSGRSRWRLHYNHRRIQRALGKMTFKSGFARNWELASKQFEETIEEIDKSIGHLEKVKAALLSAGRNLRLANDKAE